jgi:hypothetical protein
MNNFKSVLKENWLFIQPLNFNNLLHILKLHKVLFKLEMIQVVCSVVYSQIDNVSQIITTAKPTWNDNVKNI